MSQQPRKQSIVLGGITLPIDVSPAERAKLKLYSQFVYIFIFNAILAGLAVLDGNTIVNWHTVMIAAIGQGVLALVNGLEKYFKANGQLPLSMLFSAVADSASKRVAHVQYNAPQQAAQQAFNQQYASFNPPANLPNPQALPTVQPASVIPQQPVQPLAQPQQIPVVDHPSLANVPLSNTLPNIGIVQPQ